MMKIEDKNGRFLLINKVLGRNNNFYRLSKKSRNKLIRERNLSNKWKDCRHNNGS